MRFQVEVGWAQGLGHRDDRRAVEQQAAQHILLGFKIMRDARVVR